MSVYSFDFGHMEGGEDGSANGILYEYQVVRDYGVVCIRYLEQAGHTCINCTPPDSNMSLSESLAYRVNKANESGSELHLCFHANCYNGNAYGAEIEVASDNGENIATPILNKICNLGFTSRGIKRPSLYVTKHTNMTAILIEPFFIDNEGDCNMYNPDKLGKAIAEGILGYDIKTEISFEDAVNILHNNNIIGDTSYWFTNCVEGKIVNGNYMGILIRRYAAQYIILNSTADAINYCVQQGIISSPDYWVQNAIDGKTCNGSYCNRLIINIAKKLI